MTEAQLIERAKTGDPDAFAQLYTPMERPLAAFLYRLIAARSDAEDLAQEIAIRALEGIGAFPGASLFRAWLFRLAFEAAVEYLRDRPCWHPDAQIRAGRALGSNRAASRRLQVLHDSRLNTIYDLREHIDFCFTCMGRTVPAHEQAALLLVEVHGLSPEEAGQALGIAAEAVRFRVAQARQVLAGHFESRCSLIHRGGDCSECASLHALLHRDRRKTEQALFEIELAPQATPEARAATLDIRLAIIRSIDPLHAQGHKLHESWMPSVTGAGVAAPSPPPSGP